MFYPCNFFSVKDINILEMEENECDVQNNGEDKCKTHSQ